MDEMQNPLDALRDIHTPPPISGWPPAPGWWILLGLVLLITAALIYWFKHRSKTPQRKVRQDYRQAAVNELKQIEQEWMRNSDDQALIHQLSLLLKRFVKKHHPIAATYSGEQWISFLDQTGGQGEFEKFHSQLCVAPYAQMPVDNIKSLIQLVEKWLQRFPQHIDNMEHT